MPKLALSFNAFSPVYTVKNFRETYSLDPKTADKNAYAAFLYKLFGENKFEVPSEIRAPSIHLPVVFRKQDKNVVVETVGIIPQYCSDHVIKSSDLSDDSEIKLLVWGYIVAEQYRDVVNLQEEMKGMFFKEMIPEAPLGKEHR